MQFIMDCGFKLGILNGICVKSSRSGVAGVPKRLLKLAFAYVYLVQYAVVFHNLRGHYNSLILQAWELPSR